MKALVRLSSLLSLVPLSIRISVLLSVSAMFQVFLCLLCLGLASANSLSKRSLLRRGGGGRRQDHHQAHDHQAHQAHGRHRQRSRPSQFGARRGGRDGDHAEHEEHEEHHEVRAISDSYLPAAAEDYDYEDQAGYRAGQDQALPGYAGEEAEEEVTTESYETTTTVDYPDYEADSRAAEEQYGAPSNLDNSYAAPPGGDYGAPGEESVVDVARAAPSTDYSVPQNDLAAAATGTSQNGFPFAAVESRTGAGATGGGERQCPGGAIEACVGVCPGNSVRVYGACVGGCADRCPDE